ncbi:hypothetical protein PAU_01743 [Photorhabdus asymbiotica]|uniref:N-terminal Ras-GEF domain-containing protein n=1 Tax=Photorhabdus asymbiotica subsp. asymbiotica (strain ATCC 43949 / 3105-77) TaxID=553480 RepID=C7BTI0_PHOAA|nr:hypothetical protein PAU_01743 [Photorhabdus asymbiotica]
MSYLFDFFIVLYDDCHYVKFFTINYDFFLKADNLLTKLITISYF